MTTSALGSAKKRSQLYFYIHMKREETACVLFWGTLMRLRSVFFVNTDHRSIFKIGIDLIQFVRLSADLQNKYRSKIKSKNPQNFDQ